MRAHGLICMHSTQAMHWAKERKQQKWNNKILQQIKTKKTKNSAESLLNQIHTELFSETIKNITKQMLSERACQEQKPSILLLEAHT